MVLLIGIRSYGQERIFMKRLNVFASILYLAFFSSILYFKKKRQNIPVKTQHGCLEKSILGLKTTKIAKKWPNKG